MGGGTTKLADLFRFDVNDGSARGDADKGGAPGLRLIEIPEMLRVGERVSSLSNVVKSSSVSSTNELFCILIVRPG